ncbi:uncharacterized protein BO97DRAFT_5575 [Aspergillus homomorphus CBS 101889]|uniref:Uncharacterized protein n=1 Tax=Aspergillus homomorphus (strain CBS 101889) TaxID=1450537 RepID=A0A395IDY5_ASPHC|nr:hypothetical protein BO97DRAFT_5575 [Aspergillus homomorphus CBS 101889]RAL17373.1 hypothetical protein BO97DRAFT_5575 [Aspergillus homomorphus CBS 101889]
MAGPGCTGMMARRAGPETLYLFLFAGSLLDVANLVIPGDIIASSLSVYLSTLNLSSFHLPKRGEGVTGWLQ